MYRITWRKNKLSPWQEWLCGNLEEIPRKVLTRAKNIAIILKMRFGASTEIHIIPYGERMAA